MKAQAIHKIEIFGETIEEVKEQLRETYQKYFGNGEQRSDAPQANVVPMSARVPEAAPVTSSEDFDSRGLPHDLRIHSSQKTVNGDGTWRNKRGIKDDELYAVEAELKAASLRPPSQAALLPPVPQLPSSVAQLVPQLPTGPMLPPMMPTPAPLPQAPAPIAGYTQGMIPAHNLETFKARLPETFTHLINEGKVTKEWLQSCLQTSGLTAVFEISNSPAALQWFFDTLVQYQLITKV